MSTRLYRDYVLADDGPHGEVSRKCWVGTPWIIEAYTGRVSEDRDMDMRHWLHETMGDEAWPYGDTPRAGRWFRGGATIHGWTWFGFASEADMNAFMEAWPTPDGLLSTPEASKE